MGRIGPRQQRFEVLPVPSWDVADLLAAWRADEREGAAAAAPETRGDVRTAESDER